MSDFLSVTFSVPPYTLAFSHFTLETIYFSCQFFYFPNLHRWFHMSNWQCLLIFYFPFIFHPATLHQPRQLLLKPAFQSQRGGSIKFENNKRTLDATPLFLLDYYGRKSTTGYVHMPNFLLLPVLFSKGNWTGSTFNAGH